MNIRYTTTFNLVNRPYQHKVIKALFLVILVNSVAFSAETERLTPEVQSHAPATQTQYRSPVIGSFLQYAGSMLQIAEPDSPGSRQIQISADELHFDPIEQKLTAESHITVRLSTLLIEATSLVMLLKTGKLILLSPTVSGYNKLRILGNRLTYTPASQQFSIASPHGIFLLGQHTIRWGASNAKCAFSRCCIERVFLTGCTKNPPEYQIKASKIVIHPNHTLDLEKPVLYVGPLPILFLPWIRFRPPKTPGFLTPRFGWDTRGGFIFGPSGYLPLSSFGHASGHFAIRTKQGFETQTSLVFPGLELTFDQFSSRQQHDYRFRLTSVLPLYQSTAAMDIDLTSSWDAIDFTAATPIDRAITHTTSRILWSVAQRWLLETSAIFLHPFEPTYSFTEKLLIPHTSIELLLPSQQLLTFLWTQLQLSFLRTDMVRHSNSVDGLSTSFPNNRLKLNLSLEVPARMGPLIVEARFSTVHQLWLAEQSSDTTHRQHSLSGDAFIALPLVRNYSRARHLLSPFLRYRTLPWRSGKSPPWSFDDWDRLETGHGFDIGFNTRIQIDPEYSINVWSFERIWLPGFGHKSGPTYLTGVLQIDLSSVSFIVDGTLDHTERRPSSASAAVTATSETTNSQLQIKTQWLGQGSSPQRGGHWHDAEIPMVYSPWPTVRHELMTAEVDLTLTLLRQLNFFSGIRIELWPTVEYHTLHYGITLQTSCKCLQLQLTAAHRPQSKIPDIMATFQLFPHSSQ